jgi:hypothetical protein
MSVTTDIPDDNVSTVSSYTEIGTSDITGSCTDLDDRDNLEETGDSNIRHRLTQRNDD